MTAESGGVRLPAKEHEDCRNPQEPAGGKKDPPLEPSDGCRPAVTFLSCFWPPELREIQFLPFHATRLWSFVAVDEED